MICSGPVVRSHLMQKHRAFRFFIHLHNSLDRKLRKTVVARREENFSESHTAKYYQYYYHTNLASRSNSKFLIPETDPPFLAKHSRLVMGPCRYFSTRFGICCRFFFFKISRYRFGISLRVKTPRVKFWFRVSSRILTSCEIVISHGSVSVFHVGIGFSVS